MTSQAWTGGDFTVQRCLIPHTHASETNWIDPTQRPKERGKSPHSLPAPCGELPYPTKRKADCRVRRSRERCFPCATSDESTTACRASTRLAFVTILAWKRVRRPAFSSICLCRSGGLHSGWEHSIDRSPGVLAKLKSRGYKKKTPWTHTLFLCGPGGGGRNTFI